MKKIFLSFAATFSTFFAFAQMSPESFITAMGKLPWANAFVGCIMDDNCDEKEAKLAEIEALQLQAQAIMKSNATAAVNKTMSQKVDGTNVTNAQAAKMSRAEQEALVRQSAANQMGAMGISAEDLAKLQSGQMTEEQLAAKMMQAQTGFTMQELQAMEKMTDEQKVAFVQSRGKAVSPAQNQQQQKKVANNQQLMQLASAAQRAAYNVQQNYVTCLEKRFAAKIEIRQIYEKKYHATFVGYDKRLHELNSKLDDLSLTKEQYKKLNADIQALLKTRKDLERKLYAETLPISLDAVNAGLQLLRNQAMAEARTHGETYAQLYKLTGEAKYSNTDERAWTVSMLFYNEFRNALKEHYAQKTGERYNPQDETKRENQAKAILQREKATLNQLKAAL